MRDESAPASLIGGHVTLTGLPRTLLFTLRARAEEHGRSHPIIHDPLAAEWAGRIPPTPMDIYTPVFQLGTAVRAHLYDATAQRFLADHPSGLIVELGAGLSTRFHRLQGLIPNDYTTIELDLPQAITFRRQFDSETNTHIFLPSSMTGKAWPSQLPSIRPENILFIAEGVLFFLPPDEIAALFRRLRRHFPGATMALDLLTNQFSPKARAAFAASDTPMRWFVADETDLAQFGLSIAASWVVTHLFPARWQALGFDRDRLKASKGNIVIQATLNAWSEAD